MEQENSKNEGDNAAAEDLAQSQASEKKSPNLSKAKSDIAKSMAKKFLKIRKAINTSEVQKRMPKQKNKSISEGDKDTNTSEVQRIRPKQKNKSISEGDKATNTSEVQRRRPKQKNKSISEGNKATNTSGVQRRRPKQKNKSISEGDKATENDAKKRNSSEENPQKAATTSMVVHVENSQQIQKNEENTHGSGSKEKSSKSNGSPRKRRRGEGHGVLNKNRKNEETQRGKKKRKRYEHVEKHENEENSGGKGRKEENKTNEKICGLIFLCNAKTKPDCFRYRVMGLSDGKKDLVLGIRRGFKLFLYDYDLKLMYGVYKAATSGHMNIEPEAFGGAFPAQVRFSVHKDCFPLAESTFKNAIKENYNKNNKFKTELTATQVRKLASLFRPVAVRSTAPPVRSPPPTRAAARKNRKARDRPREARPPSNREASARDPYARSYPVLSHERDRQIAYGELPSTRREDIHRDLYVNGNGYETSGFQGERRHSSFQPRMSPRSGSYRRDYREQPLRQPDIVYRESVPMQRDTIPSNPLFVIEREYRTYDSGATHEMQSTVSAATANTSVAAGYSTDPYYGRYYGASLDSYQPRSGGEARLIETDHLRRRESNQVDSAYARFASDALAEYDQKHRHQDDNPVHGSSSVSHRYSFTGGSFSYR